MAVDFIRTTGRITNSGGGDACFIQQNWIPGTLGGSTADATDCLARFRAAWIAMAAALPTSAGVSFDTTVLGYSLLDGKVAGVFTAASAATFAGSSTGDLLPLQTQGLIRWRTNGVINGRRVVGRWYVPLPAESFNNPGGTPSSSYLTALSAGVTALMTAGSTTSNPGVYHRPGVNSSRSIWGLIGGSPATTWSVQRSRR